MAISVAITYPYAGTKVLWRTPVAVSASDDVGVAKVEFYVDGVLKATDVAKEYQFVWDTTLGTDGLHTLTAQAYDEAGNSNQASIQVTVDNTPPVLTMQHPVTGETVSGSLAINGSASDASGVKLMRLYVDGVLQDSQAVTPPRSPLSWFFNYDTTLVPNGVHTVKVEAYDALSTFAARSATVAVANGPPPPDNQAPVVDAGPDKTMLLVALDGTVSDDGLPSGTVTVTWSKVSGPGTVTFGSPNTIDTWASFSHPGTYVLRLTASDGSLSSSDDVTITVVS